MNTNGLNGLTAALALAAGSAGVAAAAVASNVAASFLRDTFNTSDYPTAAIAAGGVAHQPDHLRCGIAGDVADRIDAEILDVRID